MIKLLSYDNTSYSIALPPIMSFKHSPYWPGMSYPGRRFATDRSDDRHPA